MQHSSVMQMLPAGHLGTAYFLTKTTKKLSFKEILLVLAGSCILDFDILASPFLYRSHRELLTHTPLGAIIVWLVLIILFRKNLSFPARVLLFFSLFSHLILDQASSLGLSSGQINWLYPLTPFPKRPAFFLPIWEYLKQAWIVLLAEAALSLGALLVFLRDFKLQADIKEILLKTRKLFCAKIG